VVYEHQEETDMEKLYWWGLCLHEHNVLMLNLNEIIPMWSFVRYIESSKDNELLQRGAFRTPAGHTVFICDKDEIPPNGNLEAYFPRQF
jgi:hypothetical protein